MLIIINDKINKLKEKLKNVKVNHLYKAGLDDH